MTVYEEIKQMEKEPLARWIIKLLHEDPSYITEVHCRLLCNHRQTPNSECDIPEEDDCPVHGTYTELEAITALLDSETQ